MTQKIKTPFWCYIFNPKVLVFALIIWVGLVCQDFYGYIFKWTAFFQFNKYFYLIKSIVCLLIIYLILLLLNFLIKLSIFKLLYHKKIFIIVLAIWLIMNISCYQLVFFCYKPTIDVYVLKTLHLFALYSLVLIIKNLVTRRHESIIKHQLILTIIFCAIGWIFLLLTYPGCWAHDDIGILADLTHYYLAPWHHFFSGIFYVLCLQTLPFVFSVIFFQVLLNSLMFSYCVVNLAKIFTKTTLQKLVLEIILSLLFIFPPVLFHTLCGFRMGIYQFLELYLLTKLIMLYFHKDQKITWLNIIEIVFLTILVGSWRTECFFYPFIVLIVLLCLNKERIKSSVAILMSIVSLISIFCINILNTILIKNNDYSITSTIQPITAILHEVDLNNSSIEILDKIINVDLFRKTSLDNAVMTAHHGGIRKNYSKEDSYRYLAEVLKLSFKYPQIAFSQNIRQFKSVIMAENVTFPFQCLIDNFTKEENSGYYWWSYNFTQNKLNNPISSKFRIKFISLFNALKLYENTETYLVLTPIHRIFYNFLIPSILLFITLIILIIRRNWFMLIPIIALYFHVCFIVLTAPSSFFMYYLSVLLCSYVFSITIILNTIINLIEKHHKKCALRP